MTAADRATGRGVQRRVVVFDDDPTGTQTVSEVDVILDGSVRSIEHAFDSSGPLLLLTNTRSMPEREAVARVRQSKERVEAIARAHDEVCTMVLRGDSTLRGHVFAEVDAVANPGTVVLFVPAFPEGGRTTVAGEQRIRLDGVERNVADTEFARDATFGFRSRRLVDWVAEVGHGRRARMVPLDDLRETSGAALTTALLDAPPGEVVIPEIADGADIDAALRGLLAAEDAGRSIVIRSAATFMAARAGLRARYIDRVNLPPMARILVVCGSHTHASSEQLGVLDGDGHATLEVDAASDPAHVRRSVLRALDGSGVAVLATPRRFVEGTDLVQGRGFLDALAPVITAIAPSIDAVVAKGGITSARVAEVLGATRARVEGQVQAGVALWTLELPERRLPYVVVPGNVGGPRTLADILRQMGASSNPLARGPEHDTTVLEVHA
ncbi:MAG: four-carbon acid sugar kinase family protein [Chloroflexota bacterium]